MAAASSSLGGISYRVSDLQKSIDFYTKVFGMKQVECEEPSTSAKLTMDTQEDGQSAMTLNLLSGLVSGSTDTGDVSSNIYL